MIDIKIWEQGFNPRIIGTTLKNICVHMGAPVRARAHTHEHTCTHPEVYFLAFEGKMPWVKQEATHWWWRFWQWNDPISLDSICDANF